MTITTSEFRRHIGKYLSLVESEDIFISKRGKITAKLVSVQQEREKKMKVPAEAREERPGKL